MGTLFVIGTPIGNLEDITLRALRILKEADLILCEDTRVTKRLLARHSISTPMVSYHAHSRLAKVDQILTLLGEGKRLALVSDAGTPCISDPGVLLVAQIRARYGSSVRVIPVPGPSALTAALSAAGVPGAEFTFFGFLPHKKGRETLFREIAAMKRTAIFYESPHRIERMLISLETFCGPDRHVVVARELTKIHEEFVSGTISEVRSRGMARSGRIRGEFVVMVVPQGAHTPFRGY